MESSAPLNIDIILCWTLVNMNKLLLGSIVAILIALYYSQSSSKSLPGRIINTTSGSVQGIISKSRDGRDFEEWLGIPYAEPPVDQLRFAAPKPVKAWSGVRDGSQYGSRCAQIAAVAGFSLNFGSEDCLFLNVYAPKLQGPTKLPVMVWIHGGAFVMGTATDLLPDYLMDEDIVMVSLNYRLNAFGFLCPGDDQIRGNMGLKDQALALQWVRDNIEAFGGDPKRITIFGESAGGASVHHQTLSPKTQGLFQKAMIQSGVATAPWATHSASAARKMTKKFAMSVGCDLEGGAELANCLRSKSMDEILKAQAEDMENFYAFKPHKDGQHFRPCIEPVKGNGDAFITEHPLDIVAGGRGHRIPIMVGATADEGLLSTLGMIMNEDSFTAFEANWTANVARAFDIPEKSPKLVEITNIIRQYYVPNWDRLSKEERIAGYTKLYTDAIISFYMHHAIADQRHFSPVFAYHYSRRGSPPGIAILGELFGPWPLLYVPLFLVKMLVMKIFGIKNPAPDYGVGHAYELLMLGPVALADVRKHDDDPDYLFSKQLVKLWVDFASKDELTLQFRGASFRPTEKNGSVEYFDITDTSPGMIRAPLEDRAEFLKSLGLLRPWTL